MSHLERAARKCPRARILAAAAREIARQGYHGMSMRDLARATNRGLASFYAHFRSKDDVLYALQYEAFTSLLQGAEQAMGAPGDASDRLHAFVLNHLAFFADHPDVMRVLIHEAGALPPSRRASIRALKERYFAMARDILGNLSGADEAELERVTYAFFGMLNWIYGWYEPDRHGSPEVLARTMHRMIVSGGVS